ncbi:unannotated protein [freshwater metagenome]|uniref:Unannotated protein n=1 Tax=freshwater metagenome TaxID=449393 RepID=A0A6J7VFR2_9ZZZZ
MTVPAPVNAVVGVVALRSTELSPAVYVIFAPAGVDTESNFIISASVPAFTAAVEIVKTSSTTTALGTPSAASMSAGIVSV